MSIQRVLNRAYFRIQFFLNLIVFNFLQMQVFLSNAFHHALTTLVFHAKFEFLYENKRKLHYMSQILGILTLSQ